MNELKDNPVLLEAVLKVIQAIDSYPRAKMFNSYALVQYANPFGEMAIKWLDKKDFICATKDGVEPEREALEFLKYMLQKEHKEMVKSIYQKAVDKAKDCVELLPFIEFLRQIFKFS